MGTTPKPVRMLLVGLEIDEQFQVLIDQGHTVHTAPTTEDLGGYDLILGPRCWRLLPDLCRFLPLALKEARSKQPKRIAKVKKK